MGPSSDLGMRRRPAAAYSAADANLGRSGGRGKVPQHQGAIAASSALTAGAGRQRRNAGPNGHTSASKASLSCPSCRSAASHASRTSRLGSRAIFCASAGMTSARREPDSARRSPPSDSALTGRPWCSAAGWRTSRWLRMMTQSSSPRLWPIEAQVGSDVRWVWHGQNMRDKGPSPHQIWGFFGARARAILLSPSSSDGSVSRFLRGEACPWQANRIKRHGSS